MLFWVRKKARQEVLIFRMAQKDCLWIQGIRFSSLIRVDQSFNKYKKPNNDMRKEKNDISGFLRRFPCWNELCSKDGFTVDDTHNQ